MLRPTEEQLDAMLQRGKEALGKPLSAVQNSAIAATLAGRWLVLPLPPTVNDYWRHPGFNLRDPKIAAQVAARAHYGGAAAVQAWATANLRGHSLVSKEGKGFKRTVWAEIRRLGVIRPLTGRIRLQIVLHCRNKQSDIDNRVKPLLDALQLAKAYLNDNQVDEVHVMRGPVKRDGECRVWIEELTAISCELLTGPAVPARLEPGDQGALK
jgi:Holliday junction resolvase RusA-like endonuclease